MAMNNRIGVVFSALLIVAGVMFWSVSILANDTPEAEVGVRSPASATLEFAAVAADESAAEAAESIRDVSKLDLDIRLIGQTSVQVAAE